MSYDLSFAHRPGKTPPTIEQLRDFVRERPHWIDVDKETPRYVHEATGVSLEMSFHDEPGKGDEADRAPFYVSMREMSAHVAGLEVAPEIRALVEAFDLLVRDENEPGMGKGEFDTEVFLRTWSEHNERAHKWQLGDRAMDPPPVLARDRLEEVWRWNHAQKALQEELGDGVFVPTISFAAGDGDGAEVKTFIAWPDGTTARVPKVDTLVTPLRHVPWSAIEEAIADAQRVDAPVAHHVVDGEVLARVFEAVHRGPTLDMPRRVPAEAVRTRELVEPYAAPAEERAKRRRANDLMLRAQAERYMGTRPAAIQMMKEATTLWPRADYLQELATTAHEANDHLTAFEAGVKTLELDPQRAFAALVAAANGMYAAKFEEALKLADRVWALTRDRNAHVIRAASLTDLARYDEAIAACDAALAMEDEPMTENMKAYALAAAGRESEAKASYTRALAALDAQLKEKPEDADLHSRRAYALLGLGRAKEALAAANEALKLETDAFLALQSVGRAQLLLGKPKEALIALNKAIAGRAAAPMASFHAAQAYAALGDMAAAAKALRAASVSAHFARLAKKDPKLAKLVDGGGTKTKTKASPKTKAKTKPKSAAKVAPKAKGKGKTKGAVKATKRTSKKR